MIDNLIEALKDMLAGLGALLVAVIITAIIVLVIVTHKIWAIALLFAVVCVIAGRMIRN